jgi:hypothetical protein
MAIIPKKRTDVCHNCKREFKFRIPRGGVCKFCDGLHIPLFKNGKCLRCGKSRSERPSQASRRKL